MTVSASNAKFFLQGGKKACISRILKGKFGINENCHRVAELRCCVIFVF